MSEQEQIRRVILDERFGPLARREIQRFLRSECSREIEVVSMGSGAEQHLDTITATQLVGCVCSIAAFIVRSIEAREARKWDVARVREKTLDAAVRLTGSGTVENFRYEGIEEFISKRQKWCKVTVEIDDEDYAFYLSRDGDALGVRL